MQTYNGLIALPNPAFPIHDMKFDKLYFRAYASSSSFCRWLFVVLLCFSFANISRATEVLELSSDSERYELGHYLSYLKDEAGTLTLNDVMALPDRFRDNRQDSPNFGYTKSAYWFQLKIHNCNAAVTQWLLEHHYPLVDRIDTYLVYRDKRIVSLRGGDTLPFSERAVKHRDIMFDVPLAQNESVTIYMRVQTQSSLQMPLTLWGPHGLFEREHDEQIVIGVFYGIAIAMLLFNLLVYLSMRDITYLFYTQYIFGWILFQMSLNGLAFEYLWPEYPKWANVGHPFLIGFTCSAVMQFTRHFLELKQHMPRVDRLFRFHFWIYVLVMAIPFFADYTTAIIIASATAITGTTMAFITGAVCMKKRVLQAKYFMIAWSVFLASVVVFALKSFGMLPSTFVVVYGPQIGSSLEVVLLSFALAHRMRLLKMENERIQRTATEMLEQRVKQRTSELDHALSNLAAANEKLTGLSHTDGLTGVYNRAYFDERLALEWHRSQRSRSPLGLLLLDIDHFKMVNDTYGHLAGDACLKQVASVISAAVRRPTDEVFRYGGEEFVVLLPKFVVLLPNTDLEGVAHIGELVRRKIEAEQIEFGDTLFSLTVSIGACSHIADRSSAGDALIANADSVMYRAKQSGRNQVCTYAKTSLPALA